MLLWILLSLVIFLGPANGYAEVGRDKGMTPADGFFLPEGDAAAGKKAFARLKCNSCHWVQNDSLLGPPVAAQIGPILGQKQAEYSPGWIMNSIVSPSHTIAVGSDGDAEGRELSRMGDFKDSMTVRELIDIVGYIRSLDYMGVQSQDRPETSQGADASGKESGKDEHKENAIAYTG